MMRPITIPLRHTCEAFDAVMVTYCCRTSGSVHEGIPSLKLHDICPLSIPPAAPLWTIPCMLSDRVRGICGSVCELWRECGMLLAENSHGREGHKQIKDGLRVPGQHRLLLEKEQFVLTTK